MILYFPGFFPRHIPHSRQQQKQVAATMKMMANTGPNAVTRMIGVHQSANCIKKEANVILSFPLTYHTV